MKLSNITIGTDPEIFLYNNSTKQFVSAIPYIPGTKDTPYKLRALGKGFALQTDNILVEFNVPPVKIEDGEGFITNILKVKDYINKFVQRKNPNLEIKASASQFMPKEELNTQQAKLFGCDPDYNGYTLEMNQKPVLINPTFRSSGFHIHIGYDNPNIETNIAIIRYMDAFIGIQSVLEDSDSNRRTLYGKAGSFRMQPWGVEYRVLSGYFLKDTNTISWVYERVIKALKALEEERPLPPSHETIKAINETNAELAEQLIINYNLL